MDYPALLTRRKQAMPAPAIQKSAAAVQARRMPKRKAFSCPGDRSDTGYPSIKLIPP